MARSTDMLRAFAGRAREVVGVPGKVPLALKRLLAHMAESAASVDGAPAEKLEAIFEFESNPMFSDAERAALRMVLAAGSMPNAVTDENMEDLERHFDENQIVELLGVVCLFGCLNRWNDTMATPIEERPPFIRPTPLGKKVEGTQRNLSGKPPPHMATIVIKPD